MSQTPNLPSTFIRKPMGHAQAASQAAVLLGSYPREPHDPVTFTAAIIQVLSEYPEDVGREAIDKLTRRLKHYPTRADLVEVLEEVIAPRKQSSIAEFKRIRESEKREREAIEGTKRKQDRENLRITLGASWDDYWSIPVTRRYAGGLPDQFAREWQQAPDKANFTESWGYGKEISAG